MILPILNLLRDKRPKDNFDLIAMNTTVIYFILKEKYGNQFDKEKDLITTSGVIDAIVYIKEGSIKVVQLINAMLLAKVGRCSLDLIDIKHEDAEAFFSPDRDLFLNYILQLETLIMSVDNSTIRGKDVMHAVISKKKAIKEMIDITIERVKTNKLAEIRQQYLRLIDTFMTGDDYKDIRNQLEFVKTPSK